MKASGMNASTLTATLDERYAGVLDSGLALPTLPASDEADEILIPQRVTFEWMAAEAA